MMQLHSLKRTITFLLAMMLVFFFIPTHSARAESNQINSTSAGGHFKSLTLSILGDSISTYLNHSNGTAAETTNSTISGGAIYYPRSGFEVTAEHTWWYQAAQALDMDILVNNSWSGSCMLKTRNGTVGAYVDRCVQLHDNTGENAGEHPDMIAIFLGTNDYYFYPSTLGSYEDIDFDSLITHMDDAFAYAVPTTTLEAYAITLHKITQAYPDAQVYCFTLLPRLNSSAQPTAFNEDICQLANKFGAYTVDLYHCGIQSESTAFYMLMGNDLHPDNPGMDAITNAFVSAILKHNSESTYDVAFSLEGAVAMDGTSRTVISGESFETTLAALDSSRPLEITVTMGGIDITESCLTGHTVKIPSVNANVIITAKPGQRYPMNFRWEMTEDTLISVTTDSNQENPLTMTHGTITNGTFSKTRFTMEQGICLRHDLPWCVEWKSSGTWTDTTDGALLFSEANTSTKPDSYYFYRRHNNDFFAFGSYTAGNYHNYGVKFSGTGIDTTLDHIFSLENRIAPDGTNMVWLQVDGMDVGPMNRYFIGGTDQKKTVDWVNGKDFHFSYMGTSPHTIGGCSLEYVQIWENGKPETTREDIRYRWETKEDAFVSVTTDGNLENPLTMTHGSITEGNFSRTRFTMQQAISLQHDLPWCVEWKSSGTWTDNTDGALLFSEANTSTKTDSYYFYRRHNNDFFAFGSYTSGNYHNYGVKFSGTGIDTTKEHVYRLENRIAPDGSNMVWLMVDGVDVGPMNRHFIGGTDQKETVDWVSGKDFHFSYMGTTPHTIGGCSLEYVQVWESLHTHCFENGACIDCQAPQPQFYGANIMLQSNLAIGYGISQALMDDYDLVTVKCTMNGQETDITEGITSDGICYFYFRDISPRSIGDTVVAQICAVKDGVSYLSEEKSYSILEYCRNSLEKLSDKTPLGTLLVDLLNYGTAMQTYAGYKTDTPVNGILTDTQKTWGTASDRPPETVLNTKYAVSENPLVLWRGAGLTLKDTVAIRYLVTPQSGLDISRLSLKIAMENGKETIIPAHRFTDTGNGIYRISFDQISAAQMGERIYATVYMGDTPVSNTVQYSIESYAYNTQNTTNPNLAALVKAMLRYGDSAKAFIAGQ